MVGGKSFDIGKEMAHACDRYKCEAGYTMDKSREVAYANTVWTDGGKIIGFRSMG